MRNIKIVIVCISLLLFAASLTQCAFVIDKSDDGDGCWGSLSALISGWLYPSGPGFSWYANPLLVLSYIAFFKRPELSVLSSLAACLFALNFLRFNNHKIVSDEAGHYSNIIAIGRGYWLWLAACGLCFVGSVMIFFYDVTEKFSNNKGRSD